MLPEDPSTTIENQQENWQEQKTVLSRLRYRYPFLHQGVIQSFITRTYRFAEVKDIYKNGLIITVEGTKIIVEAIQDEGEGTQSGCILVTAPAAKMAVLRRIQKEFEDIHADREVEQQVCIGDYPWVKWETLVTHHSQTHLATVDGGTVPSAPYQAFVSDKEQIVLPLSESADTHSLVIPSQPIDIMTPEELKKTVRNHVVLAQTNDAIRVFKTWAETQGPESLLYDLIALENEWNTLQANNRRGVISPADEGLKTNQIVSRLS